MAIITSPSRRKMSANSAEKTGKSAISNNMPLSAAQVKIKPNEPPYRTWYRDGFIATTDPNLMDFAAVDQAIHGSFLTRKASVESTSVVECEPIVALTATPGKNGSHQIGIICILDEGQGRRSSSNAYVISAWKSNGIEEWLESCAKDMLNSLV